MATQAPRAPLSVYMLADHLDRALAAGEDLVARGNDWRALADETGVETSLAHKSRDIAEDVRALELTLVARTLKSRDHARDLGEADKRFAPVANLFVAATTILLDAVEECGDATTDDFETGDGLVAYVRSRGLIAPDVATVTHAIQFTIDDNFLVAKRIALGPLMDMAAAFLDALDTHYDLFLEDEPDHKSSAPAARSEFGRRERMPLN